jgi:hypothetical protein
MFIRAGLLLFFLLLLCFLLSLLLFGCTVTYDPAKESCTISVDPEGIKAIGEACKDVYAEYRKVKATAAPVVIITPIPLPSVAVTITPALPTAETIETEHERIVCEGAQKAPDGAGGFLFKNGDRTKKIAVLLPGRFAIADYVIVTTARGKEERLTYHGLGNPDRDGDRQHWRGSQPVSKYEGKVTAVTDGKECTWTFKAQSRVD